MKTLKSLEGQAMALSVAQSPQYRIGEAARQSGVSAANIRYYEKEGLLAPGLRADNSYRLYSADDVHHLRFIRLCRAMDMSLAEVRTLLALDLRSKADCDAACVTLDEHLQHVRSRLAELQTLEADLLALRKKEDIRLIDWRIGLYHGSPEEHEEFLFSDTPDKRFAELAKHCDQEIVITGHSHSPYYKHVGGVHFINPGSAGRMFDGDPRASFAVLELGKAKDDIQVQHHRISYDIEKVATELKRQNLPAIYADMFRQGRKLN